MGEYMYSCSDFLMTLDTPQTFKALKIPCVWGFFWTIEHYPNTKTNFCHDPLSLFGWLRLPSSVKI